jgi:hypothetical protein
MAAYPILLTSRLIRVSRRFSVDSGDSRWTAGLGPLGFSLSQLQSGDMTKVKILEQTRGELDGGRRSSASGEPGHDSLIKARYASTVLRVAQTVDQQTAARLVSGLSRDFPCPTERPEIAELHFRAINSFSELATALCNETASKREHLWRSATDGAAAWLNAVNLS